MNVTGASHGQRRTSRESTEGAAARIARGTASHSTANRAEYITAQPMSVEPFMYGPPKPSPTPQMSRANLAPNAKRARWGHAEHQ
jgi:hypothetical protein